MTGFLAIKKILCFSPKILNNRSFFIFWLNISINISHTTALILLLDFTSLILICPIEPVKSIADSIWSLFYWATLILCLSWEDVGDPRSVVISNIGQYELENKYRTGNSLDLPCKWWVIWTLIIVYFYSNITYCINRLCRYHNFFLYITLEQRVFMVPVFNFDYFRHLNHTSALNKDIYD